MNSSQDLKSGSDSHAGPDFVLIGRLQRVHGVHGEIAMRVLTDFPQRLRRGKKVFLGPEHKQFTISTVRTKEPLLLLSFEGVDTREKAQLLTNLEVYTPVQELPALPEGSFYHHQLIGLQVFENEILIGQISEVLETGANDVFVVQEIGGKELLLPNIPSVILKVNLENQRVDVHVLEGLRG